MVINKEDVKRFLRLNKPGYLVLKIRRVDRTHYDPLSGNDTTYKGHFDFKLICGTVVLNTDPSRVNTKEVPYFGDYSDVLKTEEEAKKKAREATVHLEVDLKLPIFVDEEIDLVFI